MSGLVSERSFQMIDQRSEQVDRRNFHAGGLFDHMISKIRDD